MNENKNSFFSDFYFHSYSSMQIRSIRNGFDYFYRFLKLIWVNEIQFHLHWNNWNINKCYMISMTLLESAIDLLLKNLSLYQLQP